MNGRMIKTALTYINVYYVYDTHGIRSNVNINNFGTPYYANKYFT